MNATTEPQPVGEMVWQLVIKVWIRFDGRDDEMPWPIDDVRTEVPG